MLTIEELNDRLWAWIEGVYHRSDHSALGTTPLLRWQRDIEHVRQSPPGADLRRLFFHRLDRLVRRDSTFLLRNRLYEAPPHLAGKTIEAHFDPLDAAEAEVWFEAQLQATARPLDPVVNGRLPSTKPAEPAAPEPTGINFVELVKAFPVPLRRSAAAAIPGAEPANALVLLHRCTVATASTAAAATESGEDRCRASDGQCRRAGALRRVARRNHESHRKFQTNRAVGYQRGPPRGPDRTG